MVEEIIEKFGDFHDGLISRIIYERNTDDEGKIIINLGTRNFQNDFKFENIELVFKDIKSFRLVESFPNSCLIIGNALILRKDDLITFDFFPIIHDHNDLEVNEQSDFIVKCREILFKIV